jgi:transposase
VLSVASFPTDVPTLHHLLLEQQHMIETLKANLHLALHRQFGPRNEYVNVDQFGLFAGDADGSTLIEVLQTAAAKTDTGEKGSGENKPPVTRKKAVRILKDLSREIVEQDIPESEKTCSCCGEPLSLIDIDASEHLAYCLASLKIIETRRKKYACESCHGEIKRAALPKDVPLAKSMASASLLAFLIVAKFADGLPLYRISKRLERLGIELSDALMSDWLIQCALLLGDLHRRMIRKVLDSGHIFTDDTILPLQNADPAQNDSEGEIVGLRSITTAPQTARGVRVFSQSQPGSAARISRRLSRLRSSRCVPGLRSPVWQSAHPGNCLLGACKTQVRRSHAIDE